MNYILTFHVPFLELEGHWGGVLRLGGTVYEYNLEN